MPMSSAGRAVNSDGCVTKPKECGIGLRNCFVQIQSSSLTGSYVMATAEQREPYESRGSRTVLGEPGGESPPGHSTTVLTHCQPLPVCPDQRTSSDCPGMSQTCHEPNSKAAWFVLMLGCQAGSKGQHARYSRPF